jgi:hypothetical protein
LNWDIVDEMSTVKELMLSPDGTAAEPLPAAADELPAAVGEPDELDELDELQAAADSVTTAAVIATDAGRRKRRNVPSPCRPECGFLSDLLPSLIPCPSTLMQPDEPMRDTVQQACPSGPC